MDTEAAKRAAGEGAAEAVEDGQVVGLGTGSTAAHAIRRLAERVDSGLDIVGVPTSHQARERAIEGGIPVADLDEVSVDVAIDGADQVADGDCVKGGGAAHAREKLVASDADRFLVVVDPSKEAATLDHDVPIEVLPAARRPAADAIESLGGEPTLRAAERKDGPVVTDNGNLVIDADFGAVANPDALAAKFSAIPGVVEHGLFVGMADAVYVGREDGVEVREV